MIRNAKIFNINHKNLIKYARDTRRNTPLNVLFNQVSFTKLTNGSAKSSTRILWGFVEYVAYITNLKNNLTNLYPIEIDSEEQKIHFERQKIYL